MGEAGAAIVAALSAAEQLRYGGRMPRAGSLTEYDEIIERQLDQLDGQLHGQPDAQLENRP